MNAQFQKLTGTKHNRIINLIEGNIISGKYTIGDLLPSAYQLGEELGVSRLTVMSAYKELQTRGIIYSTPGKGYYIASDRLKISHKIFLLFDELNAFKEDLYYAFKDGMGPDCQIDIFFHHFNRQQFDNLIKESAGKYTEYVIMPVQFTGINGVLKLLPSDKVYILDQDNADTRGKYPTIYQNFKKDICQNLQELMPEIRKYNKIILSYYHEPHKPRGIFEGFVEFCEKKNVSYEVEDNIKARKLKKGEILLLTEEKNLIGVIKQSRQLGLKPGRDIGIISYNDTVLKEVVADGITVISTDFREMGNKLAQMIINNDNNRYENRSYLLKRKSI